MYICASLTETGDCAVWSEYFGLLPPLSIPDALLISAGAFALWGTSWGVRLLVLTFINR